MAIRIGLSIEEYWNITPAEYFCYIKAFEERELNELNDRIVLAWYGELFARQKKLEKLDKYIIKKETKKVNNKKRMSQEEIEKHYNKKVVK